MIRPLLGSLLSVIVAVPAAAQRERCGTPEPDPLAAALDQVPWDCGYLTNSPQPEYEPSCYYDVQVVFHVIQDTSGNGYLGPATIQDQIDVLNEDFGAIAGTPGGLGADARIRFRLADTDPSGNATTGITYSMNDQWFLDNGNYWDVLAWDTTRYMNVFTNAVPCCYGYVSQWPSLGAGLPDDRIVVWWEAVGKAPTAGWPLNMGRTLTHEAGHYVGLYHTFCGGCGSATDCYGTGDLICDTNPQASPTSGCPASQSSCGNPDPTNNYMDYTDDPCLTGFTPEQVNRARCTLVNWRPGVFTTASATYCTAGTSASGCQAQISAAGEASASATSGFVLSASGVEGAKAGVFFYGTNGRQASPWGSGTSFQCVVPPVSRGGLLGASGTAGACDGSFSQDLNARWCASCPRPAHNPGAGAAVQAQLWYRDPQSTSNQSTSLSNAIEFCVGP